MLWDHHHSKYLLVHTTLDNEVGTHDNRLLGGMVQAAKWWRFLKVKYSLLVSQNGKDAAEGELCAAALSFR